MTSDPGIPIEIFDGDPLGLGLNRGFGISWTNHGSIVAFITGIGFGIWDRNGINCSWSWWTVTWNTCQDMEPYPPMSSNMAGKSPAHLRENQEGAEMDLRHRPIPSKWLTSGPQTTTIFEGTISDVLFPSHHSPPYQLTMSPWKVYDTRIPRKHPQKIAIFHDMTQGRPRSSGKSEVSTSSFEPSAWMPRKLKLGTAWQLK